MLALALSLFVFSLEQIAGTTTSFLLSSVVLVPMHPLSCAGSFDKAAHASGFEPGAVADLVKLCIWQGLQRGSCSARLCSAQQHMANFLCVEDL